MTKVIRTLIVDDEQLAREELSFLLKKHPQIEVIGEAENADLALKLITELEPDLIFLDINMPVKSGFDLLDELVHVPDVVFITAYNEFALKAFELEALDYIVKPVNPERLEKTVQKVLKYIDVPERSSKEDASENFPRSIFIKDGNNCFFVKLTDIHYIKSDGNYCEIYFGDTKAIIHKSLNLMEERLPASLFFRTNRQELINLDYIVDVDILLRNVIQVTLSTGKMIELSTRQSIRFKEIMGV